MFRVNGRQVDEEHLIAFLNAHCRGKYDISFRPGNNCFVKSGHLKWNIGGVGCESALVERIMEGSSNG